jgi:hypothetical protein
MAAGIPNYPWYGRVESDELEQGDIVENFRVFRASDDLIVDENDAPPDSSVFKWKSLDLIIMSQSCDLQKGREKVDDILLCAVWKRSELTGDELLGKDTGMEEARKGRLPAFHVLAASPLEGFEREVRVVDFRRLYSLPIGFVRKKLSTPRLRLLPPYREQLSQSFARFFMRVGLPSDIPPFKKSK